MLTVSFLGTQPSIYTLLLLYNPTYVYGYSYITLLYNNITLLLILRPIYTLPTSYLHPTYTLPTPYLLTEVYNEDIKDLLMPSDKKLKIHENPKVSL
jgi:hypothetical protein